MTEQNDEFDAGALLFYIRALVCDAVHDARCVRLYDEYRLAFAGTK